MRLSEVTPIDLPSSYNTHSSSHNWLWSDLKTLLTSTKMIFLRVLARICILPMRWRFGGQMYIRMRLEMLLLQGRAASQSQTRPCQVDVDEVRDESSALGA